MNIEVSKLQFLINKYMDEFRCSFNTDIVLEGKKHKAGSEVLLLHVNLMMKSGIKEVEVQHNVTIYEYLSKEYPVDYRKPVKWLDSASLESSLAELELINSQSKRKRFIYIVGDIYRNGSQEKQGQKEVVFRNGDRLDLQKWKSHRAYIDNQQKFLIRNSESGIILFGETESEDYVDESDFYRKKIDLVGSMLFHKFDKKFEISPDFIPNSDIFKVDHPGKLAEEYINTNARLIIFNETLSKSQKEALLQIKRYDPYVRMMVIPPISPDNIDDILLQIKMVYNTDYWKK